LPPSSIEEEQVQNGNGRNGNGDVEEEVVM